jgi:hypothetical protein
MTPIRPARGTEGCQARSPRASGRAVHTNAITTAG